MTQSPDSLNRLGVELRRVGDNEGARLHYLAALRAGGEFVPALANIASVLADGHYVHSALACLQRVVAIAPGDANQLMNLGVMLMQLERFAEAEQIMSQAAEMMPDVPQVWHNCALLQYRMGNFSEAVMFMQQVQALGHTGPEVDNDLAHMLLAEGRNLQYALEVYESRWWDKHMLHLPPWDFHVPEWQGERLDGKRILVHHEQGWGDTIMTARFVRDLALRGAEEVVFCVPEALRVWMAHQEWPRVRIVAIETLSAKDFIRVDFHSPLYSMMRWMGLEWNDIRPGPTLVPPRIECRGISAQFFNVGICWASGKRYTDMDWRHRHAPLELWLPLSANPKVKLWSLAKAVEPEEEIVALGAEALVESHTHEFRDWADTAALIANLDLIISVDTGVAHASAALGRPTWMLEPYARCWRWQEVPSGRPWYDTMRIYQQPRPGDWSECLAQCKMALDELVCEPVVPRWIGYSPTLEENTYGGTNTLS